MRFAAFAFRPPRPQTKRRDMETMRQTIDRLKALGCRGRIEGDTFVVENIPDWRTRVEIEGIMPELALIALAKEILCRPGNSPRPCGPPTSEKGAMRPIPESEGNRCNHCLHFRQHQCNSHHNLTAAMMRDGCCRYSYTPIYF